MKIYTFPSLSFVQISEVGMEILTVNINPTKKINRKEGFIKVESSESQNEEKECSKQGFQSKAVFSWQFVAFS